MQKFYAHTKKDNEGKLCEPDEWEPLFTEDCKTLEGGECKECKALDPQHGHLNKVAYLCSKFAAEIFPEGSEERRMFSKLTIKII